ncbi:MAG: DUF368 domain-containing protein [Clostridia bacterium]|nr:DUF368 domain-containing protein [Clostridia bacterium]
MDSIKTGGINPDANNVGRNIPQNENSIITFLMRLLHGAIIGFGAVLPGVSGGVLCVVFGVYRPVMELLSHPVKAAKRHAGALIPIGLGFISGFLGIAKLLGFLLERYPTQSVCVFVGLILGMVPSLFREANKNGRTKASWISLALAFFIVLAVLLGLEYISFSISPGFFAYIFCGFCVALSIIAPGMSFSTLLMPVNLYTPLVSGIGSLDFSVLIPVGIGVVVTVALLARVVTALMKRYYSCVFHAIIGIVIAATLIIIPFETFSHGVVSVLVHTGLMISGVGLALLLDKFNGSVTKPD